MKVKDLIEALNKMDPEANIITFNRTSRRWFKTEDISNYPLKTVEEIYDNCGEYGKKQLDAFDKTDVTFFF